MILRSFKTQTSCDFWFSVLQGGVLVPRAPIVFNLPICSKLRPWTLPQGVELSPSCGICPPDSAPSTWGDPEEPGWSQSGISYLFGLQILHLNWSSDSFTNTSQTKCGLNESICSPNLYFLWFKFFSILNSTEPYRTCPFMFHWLYPWPWPWRKCQ